jgi:hypothetical protein
MAGKCFQLREFTQCRGPGRTSELVEELQNLLDGAGHTGGQRVLGVTAEVEQPCGLVPQTQNVVHHVGVVPTACVRPLVRGARRPRFIECAA